MPKWTREQWLVLLVAWLGWVFDIMDTAIFNLTKKPMLTELIGKTEYDARGPQIETTILYLFLIGWSIGGILFGLTADRFGRTKTLQFTILIYAVFTGITALCSTWQQVAAVRFLTGLGIGGEWAAGAALVSETFRETNRAPSAAFLQSAAAVGPVLAALANLPLHSEDWRYLFLIGVIPALLVMLIRKFVKESGSWTQSARLHSLKEILANRRWRTNAIIALALGTVAISAATTISFWTPNLVDLLGKNLDPDSVKNWKSYVTFAMHVGTLLGVFIMPFLCEAVGRKRAFMLFFALSALVMAFAAAAARTETALLFLMPLASLFAIGISAGFVLYFPELFPTALRATGAGLAYNGGRIVTAGILAASGALMNAVGVPAGISITMPILALLGIFAAAFAPETKGEPLPEA
jgi:MFS family permease